MTDIVKRLRDRAEYDDVPLFALAADEIEALSDLIIEYEKDVARLRVENAEMRAVIDAVVG